MEGTSRIPAALVLLVDADPSTRRLTRPLLLSHGLDVIQARSGITALELLQRVPERFRLAMVSLELPDIDGAILLETLRLFRPALATLCLTASARPSVITGLGICLPKPVLADELGSLIVEALAGRWSPMPVAPIPREAVARATATFAATGSLVEAAREMARGVAGDS